MNRLMNPKMYAVGTAVQQILPSRIRGSPSCKIELPEPEVLANDED